MTEITKLEARCQRCGIKLDAHGEECIPIRRNSFDVSHEHLLEMDRMVGELLSEMLRFRSVESIAHTTFAEEFFTLLDFRRIG